ncbi:MAG: response regulator [Myxococcota bacterium]
MSMLHRILMVEDEEDIRTIARLSLEAVGGFEVETCARGDEALARVAHFQPDLILLDVMMPGMDGPETLRALKSLLGAKLPPVIFMTARSQAAEQTRLKALGAVAVVTKPFDPMTLPAELTQLWERHHAG